MQKEKPEPPKALIEDIREAARIVSDVLLELQSLTKPDVSLDLLDEIAERMIRERGAEPINKGYLPTWAKEPYPATICASVDFEVCHAAPAGRSLREGSIVKYDIGVKYKTGCGDAALTVAVGEIDNRKQRAMRYGLRALHEGIAVIKAGQKISAIGDAIQTFCLKNNYTVIKEYSGHHIGTEMHMLPNIPNVYCPEDDDKFLKEGDVICIEPIITPGKGNIAIWGDQWTAYCLDGQPVVMWEAQILVGKNQAEILTHHLPSVV